MKRIVSLFALMLVLSLISAESGVYVKKALATPSVATLFNSRDFTFTNPDCAATASCGLKRFSLKVEDYQVLVGGSPSYGTRYVADYETDTVQLLENFGIVQFIRGCIYESLQNKNGDIIKVQNIWKWQFDNVTPFSFPNWVIDSVDKDPLYNSGGKMRHGLYRWNEIRESHKPSTEHFFQNRPPEPQYPVLYVTDHTGTAFVVEGEARNVSLEFKTCIYKSSDIPLATTQENTNFAAPIICFPWQSSFVYNHAIKSYESKNTLNPFCLTPPAPDLKEH